MTFSVDSMKWWQAYCASWSKALFEEWMGSYDQCSFSLFVFRGGLLSVHGHVVSRMYSFKESEISSQTGTWVYTQLQSTAGGFQKDECWQS